MWVLTNPEWVIENEIADPKVTQTSVAMTYAFALMSPSIVDWERMNRAILSRWKPSGLERIKRMAWKLRDDKVAQMWPPQKQEGQRD